MVAVIVTSLLFCIIWSPLGANCEDFFMGKVLSVNSAKNEIEVVPEVLKDNNSVSSATEENVLVQSKVALPACVITGAKIRLWGERHPDDNTFIATEIRGCRGGGCSDPTGVRSRLSRRGKHHAWSALSNADTEDKGTGHKGRGGGGQHGGNGGNGNGNGGGK